MPRRHRKTKAAAPLAENELYHYIAGVNNLTNQERIVIGIVMFLLVTGVAVKTWRDQHPAAAMIQTAKP